MYVAPKYCKRVAPAKFCRCDECWSQFSWVPGQTHATAQLSPCRRCAACSRTSRHPASGIHVQFDPNDPLFGVLCSRFDATLSAPLVHRMLLSCWVESSLVVAGGLRPGSAGGREGRCTLGSTPAKIWGELASLNAVRCLDNRHACWAPAHSRVLHTVRSAQAGLSPAPASALCCAGLVSAQCFAGCLPVRLRQGCAPCTCTTSCACAPRRGRYPLSDLLS
jgi:hypothetical protein